MLTAASRGLAAAVEALNDLPVEVEHLGLHVDAQPRVRVVHDGRRPRRVGGKLYLAAILDLFSRFVVGWAVSAVHDRHLTLAALTAALNRRCPETGLLHHSDRGSTYASGDYQDRLTAHGITCSLSRTGDCYENAVMEAFFSTLKTELADRFDSHGQAKRELFAYIEACGLVGS